LVCRAFSDVGGQLVEGTPKSHQARIVPVPPWLATELTELFDGRGANNSRVHNAGRLCASNEQFRQRFT
jgi:hypothetical protein